MKPPTSEIVRCQYLGEFVEEGVVPSETETREYGKGENVRATSFGTFLDEGSSPASVAERTRDFTILFRQGGLTATVRGCRLRYLPGKARSEDSGMYAILTRTGGQYAIVALLNRADVLGIVAGRFGSASRPPSQVS
jgi:hypothetical protein